MRWDGRAGWDRMGFQSICLILTGHTNKIKIKAPVAQRVRSRLMCSKTPPSSGLWLFEP